MKFTEAVIDIAEDLGVEPESVIAADLFLERIGELTGEEMNDVCLILLFDALPEELINSILTKRREGLN